MQTYLLGSSNTIEGIKQVIADFWMTTPDEIGLAERDDASIVILRGAVKEKVRVIRRKGRYRFERIEN